MKTKGISDQARILHSALLQRGVEAEMERVTVANVDTPLVLPISRNSQEAENQPIRVRDRLIYTYPPQKEILGLDELQPESEARSEKTWTGSKPPEYVTDASQVFDAAQLDTTMMHKVKI